MLADVAVKRLDEWTTVDIRIQKRALEKGFVTLLSTQACHGHVT